MNIILEEILMSKDKPSYYDAMVYLNDYIYQLSETVSKEYLDCVYKLEEYYHNLFIKYKI